MLSWRERFLIACGPGVLSGITLRDWIQLLSDNQLAVDSPYLMRAAFISLAAFLNSPFRWLEDWRYGRKLKEVEVRPPIFVLGHWRSGTTHLHYLLTNDDRFAWPTFYQVFYPHTFLCTERRFSALQAFLLPQHRAYDNVHQDLSVPCEDEFAMCVYGFRTHYLSGVFPGNAEYYDQFLSLRDASRNDVEKWKGALEMFLKKLTLKHQKPLILKSPGHTGRIKLLLEMFPDAKFIHIHRDPYTVFQSFMHTYETGLPYGRLQHTNQFDWTARIIRQYREVYDAFFEQRAMIPAGHFHELGFEELERDPIGEIRKLYTELGLPEFTQVEPALRRYVDSQRGYRKNVFAELAPDLRRRVAEEWRRCFEEWGYPIG